jgi:hypothetical protein
MGGEGLVGLDWGRGLLIVRPADNLGWSGVDTYLSGLLLYFRDWFFRDRARLGTG